MLVALAFVFLFSVELCRADANAESGSQTVYLKVDGTCPRAEAVAQELIPLLDRHRVVSQKEQARETATLADRGTSLHIEVLGDERVVSDSPRDCNERARVAAVIIALRLEPAFTPTREQERPPREPERPPPDPAVRPMVKATSHPPTQDLELGVGVVSSKSLDSSMGLSAGPTASLLLTLGKMAVYASGGVSSPTGMDASGARLYFARFPLDVGGGLSISAGKWRFQPMVLFALDNFRVSAEGLEESSTAGRMETGVRLLSRITRFSGRLRPFAFLRATWFPRDYVLLAEPFGRIATTPRWWLGASLGFGVPLMRR